MRSLARLLRVREIREQSARIDVVDARRRLAAAEDSVAAAHAEHIEVLNAPQPPGDVSRLSVSRAAAVSTFEAIAGAEADRTRAEGSVESSLGRWRRTVEERDAVEELETRRRQALAYEARRSADRMLDELMVTRRRPR